MSSRPALLALLIVCAARLAAADPPPGEEAVVRESSQSDDPVILDILETGDFDLQARLCIALGGREDPFFGNIVSWLLEGSHPMPVERREHLLRLLLEAIFFASAGPEILRTRVEANREILDVLFDSQKELRDPQLRGTLVRLLPLCEGWRNIPRLAETGAGIVERLRETEGRLPDPDAAFLLDFLSAVEMIPSKDLLGTCADIARLSRERGAVERARKVAFLILGQRQ